MRKWETIIIVALLCVIVVIVVLSIQSYRSDKELEQREQQFLSHTEDFVRPYQKKLGKSYSE